MDALLLVTSVLSLRYRQATLALVMAGLLGLQFPCLLHAEVSCPGAG